ncbi:hypothetical protein [Streptococcus saliviloxodontae]|uniref:hypothetical protein n=1 Tax=Streptococcus saliviloxodontae TaxID=1349416 RepID=UPI0030B85CB7
MGRKFFAIAVVGALGFGFSSTASATTANPAPYPIIDEWNYGVDANYGYSNYFVKSPNNIGSKSSVTNYWGTVKSSSSQKYGWAMSGSQKSWNDVRLNAHWNYFYF